MNEDQLRTIKAEYDATYARDQLTNVTEAARAMLAALKEVAAHYHEADNDMVRDAIAAAEAAGIGEK